jgi:hypothetical protein
MNIHIVLFFMVQVPLLNEPGGAMPARFLGVLKA